MTPMPEYLVQTMAMAHARSSQGDRSQSKGHLRSFRPSMSTRIRSWIASGRRPVSSAPQDLGVPTLRDYPYGC